MSFLVVVLVLLLLVIVGGLLTRRWIKQEQVARLRDRARIRVIEGQLATMRAGLRIGVAEHPARRAMGMQSRALFDNRTDHEEYRCS